MPQYLGSEQGLPQYLGSEQEMPQYLGSEQEMPQYLGSEQEMPQYLGSEQEMPQYLGFDQGSKKHFCNLPQHQSSDKYLSEMSVRSRDWNRYPSHPGQPEESIQYSMYIVLYINKHHTA